MTRLRLECLCIVLSLPLFATAQGGGTVQGVVLNERGAPVAGAQVRLIPDSAAPAFGSHVVRLYQTDKAGRFSAVKVPWGEYKVFAGKQNDGYPAIPMSFYGVDAFPVIRLRPASAAAEVSVTLGAKAGAIQSVSLKDAQTGADLLGVVTLRRVKDPRAVIRVSSTLGPVLVPSGTDISIQVGALGYKPWPALQSEGKQGSLRLRPEEGIKLEVRLAREGSEAVSVGSFSPARYSPAPKVAVPAPAEGNPTLLREVKEFRATGAGLSASIERLATGFKVPIGLELLKAPSDSKSAKPINVVVENGTVRDVLDAIVAADPEYEWRESDYGTINVSPRNYTVWLPDVVVGKYSIRNSNRNEAISKLMKAPEVQQWLRSANVEIRDSKGPVTSEGGKPPSAGASLFSITLSHASVRTVLSAILVATNSRYWTLLRYGVHREFVSVTMGD